MALCTVGHVREICPLTETDISDNDLEKIIAVAYPKLIKDISRKVVEEEVEQIDNGRLNKIDGSNATFWVKNSYTNYLCDLDFDGDLDSSDIKAYLYDTNDTRTAATASTVNETGYFTLSSAPAASTRSLRVTYRYSPVSINTPNIDARLACAYLSAALAYTKIGDSNITKLSLGKLHIVRQNSNYEQYIGLYKELISGIMSRANIRKVAGEPVSKDINTFIG